MGRGRGGEGETVIVTSMNKGQGETSPIDEGEILHGNIKI